MKIRQGFVVRTIANESVVVALGAASKSFNGMIKLNDTGRLLWDKLSEGCEIADLKKVLLDEYDVDEEIVTADVMRFVDTLKGANILE